MTSSSGTMANMRGRRTCEIRSERPEWQLFRDGCPGGESPHQVAGRADRVVKLLRSVPGNVLLFSSGHFLRVLAARWIGIRATVNARVFYAEYSEFERTRI